jgi:cobaltochelatase CobN
VVKKLDKAVGDQLADKVLTVMSGSNDATLAPAAQTMVAWQLYMYDQGLWEGDASTAQQLADAYMRSVIQYGVACCHHTCKNLAFNLKVIQMSSLTPAEKQKFAEILSQATNTDPLYEMESSSENQEQSGQKDSGNGNGDVNANTLTNNTSQEQSDGSSSGGSTAYGSDPSQPGTAQSASDSQGSQGASSSAGSAKAYEISEQSASKSASATESSMPIFVIIAIIILIAIFLVGYVRSQKDEYDDY